MPERGKRVLVLNHFAAPRGQAGGTRHVELFSKLDGWEYLIIASDLNPQTRQRVVAEPGFAVVSVPAYATNGWRRVLNWIVYALRATALALRQRDVDIVYGSSPHLLAGFAAWVTAAVKRVPFVLEVRDLWPQVLVDMGTMRTSSLLYRALVRLEMFLYRRAKVIVVMAPGTHEALVNGGISEDKIAYIPNGADPEDFIPSASRNSLRSKYGFSACTAVYAGAHGPANGLDLLLDAAAQLPDLALELVLVGGGVQKTELMSRAATLGLSNVRFMDPLPKAEIPDLLAAADLGLHVLSDVQLFQSAVSPNKIFDYMAAGLPVLSNCPGEVAKTLEESQAGLGVAPTGLAEGLREMQRLPESVRGQMGMNGRSWISQNQSRRRMAKRLGDVLSAVHRAVGGTA